MTEAHRGRLLAACLHEAIADVLPQRLDFYEGWLNPKALHDGSIGRAPLTAVIGFLRTEGGAYERVVERAGTLAADWTLASMSGLRRRTVLWLPRRLRIRSALRLAARIMRETGSVDKTTARGRRNQGRVDVQASLFCSVRHTQPTPLCGFFVAIALRTLEQFGLPATGSIERCIALGAPSCVLAFGLADAHEPADPARAA